MSSPFDYPLPNFLYRQITHLYIKIIFVILNIFVYVCEMFMRMFTDVVVILAVSCMANAARSLMVSCIFHALPSFSVVKLDILATLANITFWDRI